MRRLSTRIAMEAVAIVIVTTVALTMLAYHLFAEQKEFHDLYIVAHQDDGLLFMNPDIQTSIASGHSVKTVYLTAGDGCRSSDYWQAQREEGMKAAYAQMAGTDNRWSANDKSVKEFRLVGQPNVSLSFFRLPSPAREDGTTCPHGKTLEKLWLNQVQTISPLDDPHTVYSKQGLIDALTTLLGDFRPDRINILDGTGHTPFPCKPGNPAKCRVLYAGIYEYLYDHTDHYHSALFAQEAEARYHRTHELRRYRGYSSAFEAKENVQGMDLVKKQKVFETYAEHDDTINDDPPFNHFYEVWLARRYLIQ